MTRLFPATLMSAILLAAVGCSRLTGHRSPLTHVTPAVIDSLMAPYARADRPGASVVVIRDGGVALVKSYGLARVEKGEPVMPESNFRLAPLSKQFTATAIMLLVADGKLRYDDTLATVLPLPELPAYARAVTVRQLLTHTAGLPDYEDFVPDSQTAQVHDGDIP